MRAPWYWNRDNFEALTALAAELAATPRLQPLADWCLLREKGLRKPAFAALEALLTDARTWPEADARATVLQILDLHRRFPAAHWFLSHPLRVRLIDPILDAWRAQAPADPVPACEHALLDQDPSVMLAALQMLAGAQTPTSAQASETGPMRSADPLRVRLAGRLLDRVDFATHHLSEGLFIGDWSQARADLADALGLLAALHEPDSGAHLQPLAEALDALLTDWIAFSQQTPEIPRHTFPAWCAAQGRYHRWWSIVHYDA